MARKKKGSSLIQISEDILAGLKYINPCFEYDGIDVSLFEKKLIILKKEIEEYNEILLLMDEKLKIIEKEEAELKELNEKILKGVAEKYGINSEEYKIMGGGIQEVSKKNNKNKNNIKKFKKRLKKNKI